MIFKLRQFGWFISRKASGFSNELMTIQPKYGGGGGGGGGGLITASPTPEPFLGWLRCNIYF